MNNLIDYSYFTGFRNIPNLEKDVSGFEADYITRYQKEILIKLLGYDLYLQFETGLAEETIEQKWLDLRDGSTYQIDSLSRLNPGVKEIIADYVFCKWLSVNYNQITGLGVIQANSENAGIVSPENKLTEVWNDMVNYYYSVYTFLEENEEDYTNWEFTQIQIMTYGF